MDKYVPRVGHRVRHKNYQYEPGVVSGVEGIMPNADYCRVWWPEQCLICSEIPDELIYAPRHAADKVNHSFSHSNPDDVYFDPDSSDYNTFYALYIPQHRA